MFRFDGISEKKKRKKNTQKLMGLLEHILRFSI